MPLANDRPPLLYVKFDSQHRFHTTKQDAYPILRLIEGLPDATKYDITVPRLIILDDLMNDLKGDIVANLFTKGSHHTNSSIILIVQNIYSQQREMRDISLNAHYITILKNPRDKQQVSTLDSQMFPGHGVNLLIFREVINAAGLSQMGYTPHSFRRGGASCSHHDGDPMEAIKHHGTWSSDAVQRYLLTPPPPPEFKSPIIKAFKARFN